MSQGYVWKKSSVGGATSATYGGQAPATPGTAFICDSQGVVHGVCSSNDPPTAVPMRGTVTCPPGYQLFVNGVLAGDRAQVAVGDQISVRVKRSFSSIQVHLNGTLMGIESIPYAKPVTHLRDPRGWLQCTKCWTPNEYAEPPASGPFVCGSCRVEM